MASKFEQAKQRLRYPGLKTVLGVATIAFSATGCGGDNKETLKIDRGLVVSSEAQSNDEYKIKIGTCSLYKGETVAPASVKDLRAAETEFKNSQIGGLAYRPGVNNAGNALENLKKNPITADGSIEVEFSRETDVDEISCFTERIAKFPYPVGKYVQLPEQR